MQETDVVRSLAALAQEVRLRVFRALVVAGPDGFVKGQYRKWNIKTAQTNDDFAMMREVFQRRFARVQEEDPDRDGDGVSNRHDRSPDNPYRR